MLTRSSRVVMSAMAALAVDIFPAEMPSMARERNSSGRAWATPSSRNPITVPASENSSTGRRPYLSDSTPSGGPDRMEKKGRVAMNSPITSGPAPRFWAKKGSSGRISPLPSTLMKRMSEMIQMRLSIGKV